MCVRAGENTSMMGRGAGAHMASHCLGNLIVLDLLTSVHICACKCVHVTFVSMILYLHSTKIVMYICVFLCMHALCLYV